MRSICGVEKAKPRTFDEPLELTPHGVGFNYLTLSAIVPKSVAGMGSACWFVVGEPFGLPLAATENGRAKPSPTSEPAAGADPLGLETVASACPICRGFVL